VPYVPNAGNELALDGLLEERLWMDDWRIDGRNIGWMRGSPAKSGERILFRYDSDALYVGVQPARPLPFKWTGIELTVMVRFTAPIDSADYYRMVVQPDGFRRNFLRKGGQAPEPWNTQSQFARGENQAGWSAEWVLPFKDLGLEGAPAPGTRWRMNVVINDYSSRGRAKPTVIYGHFRDTAVHHGVILVFGNPADEAAGKVVRMRDNEVLAHSEIGRNQG
jgi:hypothetical protein